MATSKPTRKSSAKRVPKVRIVRPGGRPFQLRYHDPETGKEIRISIGSRDEAEAENLKADLEAKLRLGIETKPRQRVRGPNMAWEEFREEYSTKRLVLLRDKSRQDAESRLDIAERILRPRTLGDMAQSDALATLQADLLRGKESRGPRSPHTVRSHMASVLAAINWGAEMGWLPAIPKVRKVQVAKLRHMKGRGITLEEFERMLTVTPKVVGDKAADSWRYVLRGLWESGLRIGELMNVSWDDESSIQPVWQRGRLPVLVIPAEQQKNATEEAIPLLPRFEALLLETPEASRSGYAFNPQGLDTRKGQRPRQIRPDSIWVSRIISRIGKKAGIIVRKDRQTKYASAHDLRRSLAERLYDAGIPERVVTQVMRHSTPATTRRYYAPDNVQKAAGVLREAFADVPRYTSESAAVQN